MEGTPGAGSWKYGKNGGHGRACLRRAPTASGSEGRETTGFIEGSSGGDWGIDYNGLGNGFPDNPVPRIALVIPPIPTA